MADRTAPSDFEDVFAIVAGLPGWLTRAQAAVLWDAAGKVGQGGRAVEVGSHHGKSAIVLAAGLPPGGTLVAVDPFPADWRYGSEGTEQAFRENVAMAGVADRINLRVAPSDVVRVGWTGPVGLIYIDGKHDFWTVRRDLRWSRLVEPEGWVFVHDAFSSLGVTTALLGDLLWSRTVRYTGRTGSMARLQVSRPAAADRLRLLGELPWWTRNLVVKVLLRLRLHPVARLLGHHDTADPY